MFAPIRRVLFAWWSFRRGMTLGVRGLVLDGEHRVLLVRHSYVAGWHLPGGGVEPGETALAALARELREEGGIELDGPPRLHGFFHNRVAFARDHVAVYVVRQWRRPSVPKPNAEILETGFFALEALPEGVTAGTRQRLAEVLADAEMSAVW